MKINIRKVWPSSVIVKIEIENSTHDLGILNTDEMKELAAELLSASLELQEISES
jgi:hypothetical protein